MVLALFSFSGSLLSDKTNFNSVVLANCGNKIYTGGATPYEELEWWQNEIGKWKQWQFDQDFDGKNMTMSGTYKSPKKAFEIKMTWNRLQMLGQKSCGYKVLNDAGRSDNGEGVMRYMESKYKEKHSSKKYNFSKYSGSATSGNDSNGSSKNSSFNRKKTSVNNKGYEETNPIQYMDTKYSFDDKEGQIIIDLKNDTNKK